MFNHTTKKTHSHYKSISLPLLIVMINLCVLFFPQEALAAARNGLSVWLTSVLPALLPFLIGANLLAATGFVHFLGVLLEPVMTPLFRVPGSGGFALAVGLLSGYPMGAKAVAALSEKGRLTKHDGERLLSFVNNAGPLFMIGTVGAGLFMNARAGYFIATVHYLSALSAGLLFRFYRYKKTPRPPIEKHLLRKAFRALQAAKGADDRSFGTKFGDSVAQSMETLLLIGGFIIFFCVLVEILRITNFFYALELLAAPVGSRFGLPREIYGGIFAGIVEMTSGVKILSDASLTRHTLIAAAAVISWGGLSIHAQSVSLLGKTQINPLVYLSAKLISVGFAVGYGILLFPLFEPEVLSAETVPAANIYGVGVIDRLFRASTHFGLTILAVLIVGLAAALFRKIRVGHRWGGY